MSNCLALQADGTEVGTAIGFSGVSRSWVRPRIYPFVANDTGADNGARNHRREFDGDYLQNLPDRFCFGRVPKYRGVLGQPRYVRIGNLFVSLTISGSESWNYLATKVCARDKLTVLARRHGNVINPTESRAWLRRKEESIGGDEVDPQADRKEASKINKADARITVIDVRDDDGCGIARENPSVPQIRRRHLVLVLRVAQHAGQFQRQPR
jgi:hypothetical protein